MEKFIQDREQEGLLRFWEFLKTGVRHEYPLPEFGKRCNI